MLFFPSQYKIETDSDKLHVYRQQCVTTFKSLKKYKQPSMNLKFYNRKCSFNIKESNK